MLQLYVFDPSDEFDEVIPPSALRASEYLQRTPAWRPDPGETLLLLDPAVGVSLLPINTFGWLPDIAAQFTEAGDRLAAGQRALIRSSFEARPIYLALEPAGDEVELSVLAPLPTPSRTPHCHPGRVLAPRTIMPSYMPMSKLTATRCGPAVRSRAR